VLLEVLNFLGYLPQFVLILKDQPPILCVLLIDSGNFIDEEIEVDPLLLEILLNLVVHRVNPIQLFF
jgi:hypothetical protein